jgi:hypothetical protein
MKNGNKKDIVYISQYVLLEQPEQYVTVKKCSKNKLYPLNPVAGIF